MAILRLLAREDIRRLLERTSCSRLHLLKKHQHPRPRCDACVWYCGFNRVLDTRLSDYRTPQPLSGGRRDARGFEKLLRRAQPAAVCDGESFEFRYRD